MGYFEEQILVNLKSPIFWGFCGGLSLLTVVGRKMLEKYKNKKNIKFNTNNTLYYAFHFVFNMTCVVCTFQNVIYTFNSPLLLVKIPNTLSFYVLLFHIYHIIITKGNLALDEAIHHIKVLMLCPLLWLYYSNLCDFGMFFMTGLPGGITYLLLTLKNLNLIENTSEKYISKHLNLWIRAPGCVITSYIIYLNYVNSNFGEIHGIKKFGIYLAMLGTLWNGMYFASTIIESYKASQIHNTIKKTSNIENTANINHLN
jgi:hypothetical protein